MRKFTSKYPFIGFLEKQALYDKCEQYWDELFKNLLEYSFKDYTVWYVNEFGNGKKIMDGNPIYSLINIKKKKAIRIIQHEIESITPFMCGWVENILENEKKMQSLTIVLEFNIDLLQVIRTTIKDWFNDDNDKDRFNLILEGVNSKYGFKNFKKAKRTQKDLLTIAEAIYEENIDTVAESLTHGTLEMRRLKNILIHRRSIENIKPTQTAFAIIKDLEDTSKGFEKILKHRMDGLSKAEWTRQTIYPAVQYYFALITLDDEIDFKKTTSDEYIQKVVKKFGHYDTFSARYIDALSAIKHSSDFVREHNEESR